MTVVLNRGGLARELADHLRGEVRFDEGARALFANDASIYRQLPLGVVVPCDAEDVVAAVRICHRYEAPIMARGASTGLAGQSVNEAVAFDFAKYMHHVLDIDRHAATARVQPGVVCDDLREAAAGHGLTFAVDPATHDRCTLGGMIGNNSCGTHSMSGGKTVDNVLRLEVLTHDGIRMTVGPTSEQEYQEVLARGGRRAEIYRRLRELYERYADRIEDGFPRIPRRVSGYNLNDLGEHKGFDLARALVGTESTCVFVLEATVRLLPKPEQTALLVAGYADAASAADHVPDLLGTGPDALECFDRGVLDNLAEHGITLPGMDRLPAGGAWLLAEYGSGTRQEAEHHAQLAASGLGGEPDSVVFGSPETQTEVWEVRRSTIEYTRIPGEHAGLACWEDAGVAPERLGDYIRDYCALVSRRGYHTVLFGHFGQGCMHNRLDPDLSTAAGVANFRGFLDEAGDLVAAHGGSLSGEHGDGQLRANQLVKIFGAELTEAFAEFKRIWDPWELMNPGKVVRPYAPEENLRWGTAYRPRPVETQFSYPDDEGGFADAANRCFGIGKCRDTSSGTMCPSFMVTGEEKHSTRGRARLLFEMMSGHLRPNEKGNGWRDESVKESLDLCLSCKGCKSDCPVDVDIATYKAEFLAHYYAGRIRPRAAYALGLLPVWARLASRVPRVANAALRTPGVRDAGKRVAGVARQREAPAFASRTLRDWFQRRGTGAEGGVPVLLWPDTFNNHFTPEVGRSAVRVLESAGFSVRLPPPGLCCGRPLYDYGMLPTARRWLNTILRSLRDELSAGTPIVVLEPSCLAVFRDELGNLFPEDVDARRLAGQSYSLAELLSEHSYRPAPLRRPALVQTHCHQEAVVGTRPDQEFMRALELDLRSPDSGCCGMAGSFGYEEGERYRVSMAVGERAILPEVRATARDTLLLADGFSCREQISQATGRRASHLAQVLDEALER